MKTISRTRANSVWDGQDRGLFSPGGGGSPSGSGSPIGEPLGRGTGARWQSGPAQGGDVRQEKRCRPETQAAKLRTRWRGVTHGHIEFTIAPIAAVHRQGSADSQHQSPLWS